MSTDGPVSDRKKTSLSVLMSFIQSEVLSSCHFDFVSVILAFLLSFWSFSVILNEVKNLIPSHNVHQN